MGEIDTTRASYRTLIVGLGQIGMGYDLDLEDQDRVYSHARAVTLNSDFELVGGVDSSSERRALLTSHYGCPAYPDIASALAINDIDVLIIAVPTRYHLTVLQEALAHSRPRLVLCEKPMAESLADSKTIMDLCQSHGIKLYVNFMRRADRAVREVRDKIQHGGIAGPIKGICWYSKGITHNGSHFFDLLTFWLGPIRQSRILDTGRAHGEHDAEPDVLVEFAEGTVFFLAAREESFSHYTIELLASNGRLRYEQGGHQVTWQALRPGEISGYTVLSPDAEQIETGMSHSQLNVVAELASILSGATDSTLTRGEQALATAQAIQQIIDQRAQALAV